MSVVALVIAPSIALNVSGVASKTDTQEMKLEMGTESADMTEATIAFTTVVKGEEVMEEKTFTGTQSEIGAHLEDVENVTIESEGESTEITFKKGDTKK